MIYSRTKPLTRHNPHSALSRPSNLIFLRGIATSKETPADPVEQDPTWPVLWSNCHISSAPDSCPPLNRYLPEGEKHTGAGGRGGGQSQSPSLFPPRRFDDPEEDGDW